MRQGDRWQRCACSNPIEQCARAAAFHKVEDFRGSGAILLTGASMGGFGTWELGARFPGRFCALAPVSGGGEPLRALPLARLPCCVVHGARDTVVPVERSLEMARALRGHGGEVREVIYADAGHGDAIERAYAPGFELLDWFATILAR